MALTFQEVTQALLTGDDLSWSKHENYKAGRVLLGTPESRRLFEFLLSQSPQLVAAADESLFEGLIDAWENDQYDPKDGQNVNVTDDILSGFRLDYIEAEGFGGLNIFNGHAFSLDVNRECWCLEGQNGSGKTSIISAIIWALTGQRVREHSGPVVDDGKRKPVYSKSGDNIGTWPPLATYPTAVTDLVLDAKVRVKLSFKDSDGNEAIAERSIVSSVDGNVELHHDVDTRLLIAPQLIESGILMPSRLAHINFGEKSQTLYQAVKILTGLDKLGLIGEGVENFTHGARRFLKYAKDQGVERIENEYIRRIQVVNEQVKDIDLNVKNIQYVHTKDVGKNLKNLLNDVSLKSAELADILKNDVSNDIDLSTLEGRQQVIEAVGDARAVAKRAADDVKAFTVLKDLYDADVEKKLDKLPSFIDVAETKLVVAMKWHASQLEDNKLRLKALASKWYEVSDNSNNFSLCPLCESELITKDQIALAEKLKELKIAGDEAERRLEDVCLSVQDELIKALPETIRPNLGFIGSLEPKSEIVNAATALFCTAPPFSDVLTGAAEVMRSQILANKELLPAYEANLCTPTGEDENKILLPVRTLIFEIQQALELSKWWNNNRSEFVEFWKNIIGLSSQGEALDLGTLLGQVMKIEDALAASQPFDLIMKELIQLELLAKKWALIQLEQNRRIAIAESLKLLKDLRTLVNTETSRSIAVLSDRIKSILKRIHLSERLDFNDADLIKKEVHVRGSFTEEMKLDALPIANTSWLRAILWAFIYALREQTLDLLKANPFPLLLLDDPQTTFDPRNKRKWAKELSRLAKLDESDHQNAQIFLTTHERQFFTFLIDLESLPGQKGKVAPVDDASGCVTIVSGNILDRIYSEAVDNNDDAKAREFIRQTRVYIEKLIKHMLRSEGPHIAVSNINKLCRDDLGKLIKNHTAPFNRTIFKNLLNALSGTERGIRLINDPPHTDDETIGVAEAVDVFEFWDNTLKNRIHKAFDVYAEFVTFEGDPRTFDYPDTVVTLPIGQHTIVKQAELFCTGIAAAAKTDGRIGDGLVSIEEWEDAEKTFLPNHEIYRLEAGTLEPVASIGDFVIVSNFEKVVPKDLVAVVVGDCIMARRYNVSVMHPELAILTAQAIDPNDISEPQLLPIEGLEIKKIVGTLFVSTPVFTDTQDELSAVDDPNDYLCLLDKARLFKVDGRSAEPIALHGQSLIVGAPIEGVDDWVDFDGRLVIAIDSDGGSYFKRFRSVRSGIFILESLNPDGTASAEILSADGRNGIPQLRHILPVLGVLFKLPD